MAADGQRRPSRHRRSPSRPRGGSADAGARRGPARAHRARRTPRRARRRGRRSSRSAACSRCSARWRCSPAWSCSSAISGCRRDLYWVAALLVLVIAGGIAAWLAKRGHVAALAVRARAARDGGDAQGGQGMAETTADVRRDIELTRERISSTLGRAGAEDERHADREGPSVAGARARGRRGRAAERIGRRHESGGGDRRRRRRARAASSARRSTTWWRRCSPACTARSTTASRLGRRAQGRDRRTDVASSASRRSPSAPTELKRSDPRIRRREAERLLKSAVARLASSALAVLLSERRRTRRGRRLARRRARSRKFCIRCSFVPWLCRARRAWIIASTRRLPVGSGVGSPASDMP